jgi:RNA polymerase sigma-70 factor (ECF subfamily)
LDHVTEEPWRCAAELVRAAQSGDALAMDELLTLVRPYVVRLCRPIAVSRAEDAVQEVLVAIFRGVRSLRDPLAFYGWARVVAVREAMRVARQAQVERAVDPADLVWLAGRDALAGVGEGELSAAVRDVLARMPLRHRAVLVLREVEGLDEVSVARVLGVAPGTVKSRLHRARSAFRGAWQR